MTRFIVPEPIELGAKNEESGERGPPLGRRPANPEPEMLQQQREDERYRNAIEGKFGQAKSGATPVGFPDLGNAHQERRFSLGRIMAKLSDTAESSIAITFLVINLEQLLKQLLMLFFCFRSNSSFFWKLVSGFQGYRRPLKEY